MLIKLLGHYWTKIFIYLRNYKRTTKTFFINKTAKSHLT